MMDNQKRFIKGIEVENEKELEKGGLSTWKSFSKSISKNTIKLSPFYSHQFLNTPLSILWTLSHYKFAHRLIKEGANILDVGCNGGLGTILLASGSQSVCGIDIAPEAIESAQKNFSNKKIKFFNSDIFNTKISKFDAVVIFDVIEHIQKKAVDSFYKSVHRNLKQDGICFIGTPNENTVVYSSKGGNIGHINYYSWKHLKTQMEKYFKWVFLFSANDEVIHTGFYPMAHYFIGLGIQKIIEGK